MDQSIELLEHTLSRARQMNDRRGEAQTLCSLGMAFVIEDKRRAMEFFDQSIKLAREVRDPSIEGHALWGMCMVWMASGIDTPEVRDLERVALRIFEGLNDQAMASLIREVLANRDSKER
jgi:hypothetical protein